MSKPARKRWMQRKETTKADIKAAIATLLRMTDNDSMRRGVCEKKAAGKRKSCDALIGTGQNLTSVDIFKATPSPISVVEYKAS